MKNKKWVTITVFLIAIISCDRKQDEIIVCGDDKVIVIDRKASDRENIKILWSWKVSEVNDLPDTYQKLLIPTDECKPVARIIQLN